MVVGDLSSVVSAIEVITKDPERPLLSETTLSGEGARMAFQQIQGSQELSAVLSILPAPTPEAPRFCDLVASILGCRRCVMKLWGNDGQLVVDETVDRPPDQAVGSPAATPVAIPESIAPTRPIRFSRQHRNHKPSMVSAFVSDTLISFPFELPDRVTGVLTAMDRKDGKPFGPDDLELLTKLSQFYASTYETPARREAMRLRSELRALRNESIRAEEFERQRLSREMHDDLGHALTTAILGLDMHWQQLPSDNPSRCALIAARKSLTECADRLHEFAFHLRPIVLQDLGLTPALRSLARRVTETGALEAVVMMSGHDRRVSDDVELTAFRIAQEALTNALKHAQATKFTCKITFLKDSLELVITDNGIGFDSCTTMLGVSRHGQGIVGMRERAELVGGSFEVESQEGRGTEIWALLPLAESIDG